MDTWCACIGSNFPLLEKTGGAVDALVTSSDFAWVRISISYDDEPLVVDWDKDGDLDVIVRTKQKLILFESRPAGFVQVEPNPFEGLEAS